MIGSNMPGDVLDHVRRGSAFVVENARFVEVDGGRLTEFADSIPMDLARPHVDTGFFFIGEPQETAAYVLTFTAVNFGSGWHPNVEKVPGKSGSVSMMTRLSERFRTLGPLSATQLAEATPAMVSELFMQPRASPVQELMALFADALSDLGQLLLTDFDGSFTALIEQADHSAVNMIDTLLRMPMFRDVAQYDGEEIPLLKRAQIASADLAAALAEHPLGRFDDLDRLTIFADNLVPHVLRVEGVLRYEPDLLARITDGELLVAGSPEEVEIRASAIWAVDQMVEHLRRRGEQVSAAGMDYFLWSAGQAPRYKALPRHRCLTVFY
jgi:Potential Queuosine, Q, salvage protein family